MAANVGLPPGFELDQPSNLPPGFEVDKPYEPTGKIAAAPPTSTLPENAGLARLATNVLGAPVDAIENAINIPPQLARTGLMAAGRYDLASKVPVLQGSVGGSQYLQQKLRDTRQPGLSPDNPQPGDEIAKARFDFVSRGGLLPGGALPAAGSIVAEQFGGPEWAGVGSLVPTAAIRGYNAARAPGYREQQQHQAVRDENLKKAQAAGYVAPPSQVQATFVGNRLESIAGKHALNQDAVNKNQVVTDNLARKAAGLPDGARITTEALDKRLSQLNGPYVEVSNLSPLAANALQRLRDARAEARLQWDHYERQRVPDAMRAAKAAEQQAATLENVLERVATQAGKPRLVQELRQARMEMAKVHDVKRALNPADGHVDAQDIGRALERGAPMTGELKTIGDFALAFPQVTRAAAKNPTPGVSALEPNAAAGMALAGQAAGAGWFPAGVPLAGPPVRGMLLSKPYQDRFAQPSYTPALQPESQLQALYRAAILENEAAKK